MKIRTSGKADFYRTIFALAIPMIIQNGITNFVSLLDNIMVGQIGTAQMSGVSIINQLLLVFNLTLFGISNGAGLFSAQYFGAKDMQGVRYSMRFRILASVLLSALCMALLIGFDAPLIGIFLRGEGSAAEAEQIMQCSKEYLYLMLWGLIPFALSNAYAGTLREGGQAAVPMLAGVAAVFVNLVLNYILIFGHLGMPAMGVHGAAIATVLSRFVELLIMVLWTHCNPKKNPFIKGLYRSISLPLPLLKQFIIKGIPLTCNEVLWACANTFIIQCYSTCSLDVVSGMNITNTVSNLFNVVIFAMGNAAGIILGKMLGAGSARTEIRKTSRKLIWLSFFFAIICGAGLAGVSNLFPQLYNTSDSIRTLSASLILILALTKPFMALVYTCYSIIRSGGKIWMTFVNDSGFMWVVNVPLAFVLTRYTQLDFPVIFAICQLPELLKILISALLLRTDSWMQNLTRIPQKSS